ncbi:MAG: Crp/Fnr family transcriptional regulator, partial [bacterium]|nr:Crp/Fnr family transcriptional regulator [bacterium]
VEKSTNDELLTILTESPLGKAVGEELCREILKAAGRKHWPEGSLIFQEGDAAGAMYLVCRGMVKLARISPDGRENVLAFVEPPHLFAEAAMFLGRFPATATALADTELLVLHRAQVLDLIRRSEEFLNFLFGTIAHWLQRLVAKMDELTLSSATARVARYLLAELDKNPPRLDFRVPRVMLLAKKGDLATLLNISGPSLSRILRKLSDDGVIEVQARTIYLKDLPALQKLMLPPLE